MTRMFVEQRCEESYPTMCKHRNSTPTKQVVEYIVADKERSYITSILKKQQFSGIRVDRGTQFAFESIVAFGHWLFLCS